MAGQMENRILVFGSLNIDRTYTVDHFVQPGETMTVLKMESFCGGKGFNQAVAIARAGVPVSMAGAVGSDGQMLIETLEKENVDTGGIKRTDGPSGHAVIQVDKTGNNCILVVAGANGTIEKEDIEKVLEGYGEGDWLVLQNEISSLETLAGKAAEKKMRIVLNPSPFDPILIETVFPKAGILIVNEIEAALAAKKKEESCGEILKELGGRFPDSDILMTLGPKGSVYKDRTGTLTECGIYPVKAADTTAAGDCFTGYFLAERTKGKDIKEALMTAAIASGISVSRKGAALSIPRREEVDAVPRSFVKETESTL